MSKHTMFNTKRAGRDPATILRTLLFVMLVWFIHGSAIAAANALKSIDVAALPDDRVQLTLTMSQPATKPLAFTIDNPARIAFDFSATENLVEQRRQPIGIGMAKSVSVVQANQRTRVVLNLVRMVSYQTRVDGNNVIVTLDGGPVAEQSVSTPVPVAAPARSEPTTTVSAPATAPMTPKPVMSAGKEIQNVDFRRGPEGEGRVVVTLSDPSIPIDIRQESGNVVVDFYNTDLPVNLERRLDVTDFATPVGSVATREQDNRVRMTIKANGEYEYLAYQSDNVYTVEVRAVTKEEQERRAAKKREFKGENLSLNFQDVEVRSVLQLIADFTGLNLSLIHI